MRLPDNGARIGPARCSRHRFAPRSHAHLIDSSRRIGAENSSAERGIVRVVVHVVVQFDAPTERVQRFLLPLEMLTHRDLLCSVVFSQPCVKAYAGSMRQ
jgi:hypothetical protein